MSMIERKKYLDVMLKKKNQKRGTRYRGGSIPGDRKVILVGEAEIKYRKGDIVYAMDVWTYKKRRGMAILCAGTMTDTNSPNTRRDEESGDLDLVTLLSENVELTREIMESDRNWPLKLQERLN